VCRAIFRHKVGAPFSEVAFRNLSFFLFVTVICCLAVQVIILLTQYNLIMHLIGMFAMLLLHILIFLLTAVTPDRAFAAFGLTDATLNVHYLIIVITAEQLVFSECKCCLMLFTL